MGKWSGNKVDQNYINNGNEYEQGDRVSREQLNAMVNSGLYVQDFIEDLTKKVEVENPNPNLDPEVEIIDSPNASPEKPYKRLKLKNFKGRKGDKGDVGNGWYLPIGTIVSTAIYSDNPALHLLDGSSLLKTGVYEEFCTWVENRISSDPSAVPTCTIDEYASDMATYGQCGKFVINNAEYDLATDGYVVRANSIKLPTITEFIASNNGGDAIGLAQLDEFKSHNHYIPDYADVGATNDPESLKVNAGINTITGYYSVYTHNTGGEETRPKNVRYPYYIVVATATKTDVQVDLDNVANDINNINTVLSRTEQIELIYNKSSTDIELNWGLTAGIYNNTINRDFSKYKRLRCYCSNSVPFEIPCDGNLVRMLTQCYNLGTNGSQFVYGIQGKATSTYLEFKSLNYQGAETIEGIEFIDIYKIEGVY